MYHIILELDRFLVRYFPFIRSYAQLFANSTSCCRRVRFVRRIEKFEWTIRQWSPRRNKNGEFRGQATNCCANMEPKRTLHRSNWEMPTSCMLKTWARWGPLQKQENQPNQSSPRKVVGNIARLSSSTLHLCPLLNFDYSLDVYPPAP